MRLPSIQFRLRPGAARKQSLSQLVAKKQSEQGLTLMEVLVAILVITIAIAVATPPIMVAVAVRVQNRRAEQALQIAQQEIERVRVLIARGDNPTNEGYPPESDVNSADVVKVDPPTTSYDCPNPPTPCSPPSPSQALVKGEDNNKFLVQTFRDVGEKLRASGEVVAFRMGVRVYSIAAKEELDSGGTLGKDPIHAAKLNFTTGQGDQRRYPLAVLYVDLVRSDAQGSLCRYINHLNKGKCDKTGI
jgi:prepilin-type N-terminal cleavage/methylation domain-containing protein